MAQRILVTGASGFLGSHIVIQLLNEGFYVRAAARGAKAAELARKYVRFGNKFEVVTISDITTDQFPEALRNIDAVIHTASPLPGRQAPEAIFSGAVNGTLNVLRQVEKAGIGRVVATSSMVTVYNDRNSFTDQDWFPITREKALAGSTAMDVYYAAKTLAEQDLWAFADAHPNLDITTINPPFLYGPFADDFDLPTPDYYALSGNIYIYRLLDSSGVFPPYPGHADVRDAANAHVLALASPPNSAVGRKRILFASPHGFSYAAVIELIARERPALKERLIKTLPPELLIDRTPVDFGRIQQVLGLSKSDFKTVEDTMLSTVDSLLEIEKKWVAQGHQISIPHP